MDIKTEITLKLSMNEARAIRYALGKLSMQSYKDDGKPDSLREAGEDVFGDLSAELGK